MRGCSNSIGNGHCGISTLRVSHLPGCTPTPSGFPHAGIGAIIADASRIIHIPLSGDCKAQAKGIRQAHGLHESYFRDSVLIRSAAEAKIREADRPECEAWNAIM